MDGSTSMLLTVLSAEVTALSGHPALQLLSVQDSWLYVQCQLGLLLADRVHPGAVTLFVSCRSGFWLLFPLGGCFLTPLIPVLLPECAVKMWVPLDKWHMFLLRTGDILK